MKPTYEELEAKCQLQQNKLDSINQLMGVIESASDLAKSGIEKLEQQLAAVVAENAGLKQAINTHSQSTHFCEVCGKDDPCSTDDVCYVLNETPATDAYLAEVRAEGVESAGEYLKDYAQGVHEEARLVLQDARELCNGFAAQLRQGAAL